MSEFCREAAKDYSLGALALGQLAHECALKVAPDEIDRSLFVKLGAIGHFDPLIHQTYALGRHLQGDPFARQTQG